MENNIRIWLNLKFYICMHLSLAAQVLYYECEMQPQILKTKDFSFDRLNIIVVFQKGVERNYSW